MKKGQKFTKWIKNFDIEKILNLEKEGKNIKEISKILQIPNRRLGEMLKEFNIDLNSKKQIVNKNNNFFEKIDTEIKAYLLGYTLADGCVSIESKKKNGEIYSYSKRIAYCVSIDDREVINLLQSNISPTSYIKEFHNPKGAILRKNQLQLRFSSTKLVEDLIKLNIKPNKTYNSEFQFNFDNMDKSLIRHFIRGFFDGDGYCDKGSLQFVSTSYFFLKQIEEYFKLEIPNITFRFNSYKGKTIDYYKISFNTGKGILNDIYNLFYKDSNYYLSRKKNKFNIENTVLNSEITKGSESV